MSCQAGHINFDTATSNINCSLNNGDISLDVTTITRLSITVEIYGAYKLSPGPSGDSIFALFIFGPYGDNQFLFYSTGIITTTAANYTLTFDGNWRFSKGTKLFVTNMPTDTDRTGSIIRIAEGVTFKLNPVL